MTTPPVAPATAEATIPVTGSPVGPVTGIGRVLGLGAGGTADPTGATGGMPYERAELVPDVVLHAEQLRISTRRVPVERVRFVRRIITETRMVPVEVRREVLEVERTPLTGDTVTVFDAAVTPAGPVVLVLHEEFPLFILGVRAVEQVTATVTRVAGETAVRAEVSSEQVEVIHVPPPAPQV